MPATQTFGDCHLHDSHTSIPATHLLAQSPQTSVERLLGQVEFVPLCDACFDRFGASFLGGAR